MVFPNHAANDRVYVLDILVSLQVFRALRPTLSSEACTALMAGLAKCLANPSKLSLEVAADVVLTLQVCSAHAHQLIP